MSSSSFSLVPREATEHVLVKFTSDCLNTTHPESLYVYIFVTLSVSVINVLMNTLALLMFQDRLWRCNLLTALLKCFSLLEILFNVCLFLHMLFEVITPSKYVLPTRIRTALFIESSLLLLDTLLVGFQVSRNWLVVALAYARFIIICRPSPGLRPLVGHRTVRGEGSSIPMVRIPLTCHTARHLWFTQTRRLYPAVFFTTLLLLLLVAPRKFEDVNYFCVLDGSLVNTVPLLRAHPWFWLLYQTLLMFLIQSGGPVLLVMTFSILIVLRIHQQPSLLLQRHNARHHPPCSGTAGSTLLHRRLGRSSSAAVPRSSRSPRCGASLLVIVLCGTFTVLEMPSFVTKLFLTPSDMLGIFANTCVYLDSTLNFFIYACSNRTFRECLARRFCSTSMTSTSPGPVELDGQTLCLAKRSPQPDGTKQISANETQHS